MFSIMTEMDNVDVVLIQNVNFKSDIARSVLPYRRMADGKRKFTVARALSVAKWLYVKF